MIPLLRRLFGYEVWNYKEGFPPDYEDWIVETIRRVAPYTTTSKERIHALCKAVDYVVDAGVPGALVECGVWRGGSMMAVALSLLRRGRSDRDLYLFDTFSGMAEPGPEDVDFRDDEAVDTWRKLDRGDRNRWCHAPLQEVRHNMEGVGYDESRTHYVEGRVEDTLPERAPERIALLRLDTDWYSSVRHELEHLYPRLSRGGVLVVDDYGHWRGARRAVQEYLAENDVQLLLHRVDYTARIAVKP